MPPSKTRFITACQQILALGVVLAALTPAASVVSLDVVREPPSGAAVGRCRRPATAAFAAYTRASAAQVRRCRPQTVDPKVTRVLPDRAPRRPRARRLTCRPATRVGARPGSTELTSRPEAGRRVRRGRRHLGARRRRCPRTS